MLQTLAGASTYAALYSYLDLTIAKITAAISIDSIGDNIKADIDSELRKLGATGTLFGAYPVYIDVNGIEGFVSIGLVPGKDNIVIMVMADGNQKDSLSRVISMWRGFGCAGKTGINVSLNDWINNWNSLDD